MDTYVCILRTKITVYHLGTFVRTLFIGIGTYVRSGTLLFDDISCFLLFLVPMIYDRQTDTYDTIA